MTEPPKFECAPGIRLQAHERLSEVHYRNMEQRFERMEETIKKLEQRLWLALYGIVAVILAETIQGLLAVAP
jgi:hypothetical protein